MTADCGLDNGRVLIIDDDPAVSAGFEALLALDGIEVQSIRSAIAAPFTVRAFKPDLILLDLGIPALSGEAFLLAGGRRALRTDAPILLFSGRSRQELSRLTEELGADGFLSKGQELSEIVTHINRQVRQRRALLGPGKGGLDGPRTAASTASM